MDEKTCDNCVWKENECYGEEVCERYKKGKYCENCKYAEQTDIDGLIDCKKDGHSKDSDMVCEQFASD